MDLNGLPIAHGMEVEQCSRRVPHEIREDPDGEYFGEWYDEYQGMRELEDLGPSKRVKGLIERFQDTCRQHDDEEPWEWSNETYDGHGCGSHVHMAFQDAGATREDRVEGYTITWNTAVELTPFLAPFFCADWKNGFRSSVTRWAAPQLTRYSQSTMAGRVDGNRARSYDSVTLNPGRHSGKPLTIELRLNEAHPATALPGVTFLRRTATKCMREGWSPKLAGDRRSQLTELYDAVYSAAEYDGGIIEAMKSVGPFRFREGRGIPGTDKLEYETAWDVLMKIMAVNGIDRGAYDDHVKKLIQAAGGELPGTPITCDGEEATVVTDGGDAVAIPQIGPQNNTRALWHTCDADFEWDLGPEVEPRY
jgi:hypothetical protein